MHLRQYLLEGLVELFVAMPTQERVESICTFQPLADPFMRLSSIGKISGNQKKDASASAPVIIVLPACRSLAVTDRYCREFICSVLKNYCASIASNSASSITLIPSCSALSSLLPASIPATT